ncbi:MAG: leucine-rich repeat protein, partial [Clostridia bacterium]|nr:leucine-rich repeat protein [Clostridia bacterium]
MGIISEMIQRGLLSECDVQEYNIATNARSFNGRIVDDGCLLLFARMDLLDGKAVVPTGITKIANGAFDGCYSALETVVLPETLEEIDDCAFYECGRLTNINMPKSLKR